MDSWSIFEMLLSNKDEIDKKIEIFETLFLSEISFRVHLSLQLSILLLS